jgi:hypothetical protein
MTTCSRCKIPKRKIDFYDNGRNVCRKCTRSRVKLWAKNNRERAKIHAKKYRNSALGILTRRKCRSVWRARNTSAERERHRQYVLRMPDAYVRKLMRQSFLALNPTQQQIDSHRNRLSILRAQRTFKLLSAYGAKF